MCLRVFLTYSVTSKLTVKFLKRAIVFDLQLDFSSALNREEFCSLSSSFTSGACGTLKYWCGGLGWGWVATDSTVLAHVLTELNRRHNYGLDLFLLSIDEGITGYRDDSLETVMRNEIQVKSCCFLTFMKSELFFVTSNHVCMSLLIQSFWLWSAMTSRCGLILKTWWMNFKYSLSIAIVSGWICWIEAFEYATPSRAHEEGLNLWYSTVGSLNLVSMCSMVYHWRFFHIKLCMGGLWMR
jgi:hypothetical protein